MNAEFQDQLCGAARAEAESSSRCLAAAERAVSEGRLNIAKLLRASALSARQRALALNRVADQAQPAAEALAGADGVARATAALLERHRRDELVIAMRSALSLDTILAKAVLSLGGNADIPESVVSPIVWVCEECGYTVEAQRAEICPSCGSLAGDFAMFAPFFSGTPEHLARRKPEDALTQLRGDGDRLSQTLVGDDEVLRARPASGDWCAKEIAGHMCDILELAERRLRAIVDPEYVPPRERSILPWRLLDTEDYPNATAAEIVARFRSDADRLCGLLDSLSGEDWRKKVDMGSGRTAVVDVASWAANHNVAHLAQLRRHLGSIDG